MNNLKYIFSGSRLYKVIGTYKNLITVTPTQERLSKQITNRTYASNQLESLGFVIVLESSRCFL
jgi:hypothetical protein